MAKPEEIPFMLTAIPEDISLPVDQTPDGDLVYIRFSGDPKWHALTRFLQWSQASEERYDLSVQLIMDGVVDADSDRLGELIDAKGGRWVQGLSSTLVHYWQHGELPKPVDDNPPAKAGAGDDEADDTPLDVAPANTSSSSSGSGGSPGKDASGPSAESAASTT